MSIPAIDLAWEAVNALGGWYDPKNPYDQGFSHAISQALEEIEKLGGKDPSYQRAVCKDADLSRDATEVTQVSNHSLILETENQVTA